MKKSYILPEIKLVTNGNLECVFASGIACGREMDLSNWLVNSGSPHKATLRAYCKDANSWMQDIDNHNSY